MGLKLDDGLIKTFGWLRGPAFLIAYLNGCAMCLIYVDATRLCWSATTSTPRFSYRVFGVCVPYSQLAQLLLPHYLKQQWKRLGFLGFESRLCLEGSSRCLC